MFGFAAYGRLYTWCVWCVWSLRGRCLVPLRVYTWCLWSLRRPIHQVHSSVRRQLITIKSQFISEHTTSPLSMLFYPSSHTVQTFPHVRKKNKSKTYNSFPALQPIGDSLRFFAHYLWTNLWRILGISPSGPLTRSVQACQSRISLECSHPGHVSIPSASPPCLLPRLILGRETQVL